MSEWWELLLWEIISFAVSEFDKMTKLPKITEISRPWEKDTPAVNRRLDKIKNMKKSQKIYYCVGSLLPGHGRPGHVSCLMTVWRKLHMTKFTQITKISICGLFLRPWDQDTKGARWQFGKNDKSHKYKSIALDMLESMQAAKRLSEKIAQIPNSHYSKFLRPGDQNAQVVMRPLDKNDQNWQTSHKAQ